MALLLSSTRRARKLIWGNKIQEPNKQNIFNMLALTIVLDGEIPIMCAQSQGHARIHHGKRTNIAGSINGTSAAP